MHSLPLFFITLCTFLTTFVNSQTVWSETFVDSNFTNNPNWSGDTSDFIVNSSNSLQLFAPSITSSKILQTNSTAIWNASWQFQAKMDFNPSTNNYCEIHFASSTNFLDGYFIRLGGNSQDRIGLYKTINGQNTKLLESTDDWLDLNKVDITVKIERDSLGMFSVYADTSGIFQLIGSIIDSSHLSSSLFGWHCHYTATRSEKFYLDNIHVNGTLFTDNKAPVLHSSNFIDSNTILLTFSEPLDSISAAHKSNYILSPNNQNPLIIDFLNSSNRKILLLFKDHFQNKSTYTLHVKQLFDFYGNKMMDTTITLNYLVPEWGDVVLSEIMFDPTPPVLLPEVEYIELYNNSKYTLNLKNWILKCGNSNISLPDHELPSHSYVLIADSSSIQSFSSQNKIGVNWPNGFLNNSGNTLEVYSNDEILISQIDYHTGMFTNQAKANGGWSLENKDVSIPCSDPFFWEGCLDLKGGTPGFVNSQNTFLSSTKTSYVSSLIYKTPLEIIVNFSERTIQPVFTSDLKINSVHPINNLKDQYSILFDNEMQEDQLYSLEFVTGTNCQSLLSDNQTLSFGIPVSPDSAQVLINEILFNPSDENTDFIEILNTGNNCVLLNQIRFANVNEVDYLPENIMQISTDSILLPPQEYFVFTKNRELTNSFHGLINASTTYSCNLPSMPDNNGSIGICTSSLNWVDFLIYDESWHHELLSDHENVSLERVFTHGNTNDKLNWHSASFFKGFATPTSQNSQNGKINTSGSVTLSSDLITPNNDGMDDFVTLQFNLDKPGWVINVNLFDAFGREQMTLANNKYINNDDKIIWNGTSDSGQLVRRGAYIIFIELWHPDGEKMIFKKTIVVHHE